MSFQLSGAKVVLPTTAAPTGACPSSPVKATKPREDRGLRVSSPTEYAAAATKYRKELESYAVIDDVDSKKRKELNLRASNLRAKFESLGAELKAVQDAYGVLRDYDDEIHDVREAQHEALMLMYNSLPPDSRLDAWRPPTNVTSNVNTNDTSSKFRDTFGRLIKRVTEQATDRSPDWLDTLTDVVGAVTDGWAATGEGTFSRACTNSVQRSRAALSKAVCSHALLHMEETWKPAVTLNEGESLSKHVDCSFSWDDMYTPDLRSTEPNAVGASVLDVSDHSIAPSQYPEPVVDLHRPLPVRVTLGDDGLQAISMSVLAEVGNYLDAQNTQKVSARLSKERSGAVGERVNRLAGVSGIMRDRPWYKQ